MLGSSAHRVFSWKNTFYCKHIILEHKQCVRIHSLLALTACCNIQLNQGCSVIHLLVLNYVCYQAWHFLLLVNFSRCNKENCHLVCYRWANYWPTLPSIALLWNTRSISESCLMCRRRFPQSLHNNVSWNMKIGLSEKCKSKWGSSTVRV